MKRLAYLLPIVLVAAAAYFLVEHAALQSREPAVRTHHLVLQVNSNDPATMNLVLNNASNVEQHYKSRGEPVEIEVVAFGPGLHMLRDDTSPVKDRLQKIAEAGSAISFKACGNTRENMRRNENKAIPLVSQAAVVGSGVVRVMELQEQGWTYVRP
jgi:intracellular sulfur oxidation DsrE/DsrF family protein